MVNIPVEAYTKSAQIIDLFKQVCLTRIEAFAPEMVFFSAGFDAHREDEMGQLSLVEADYAELTAMVVQACAPSAGHRLVSMLEGGTIPRPWDVAWWPISRPSPGFRRLAPGFGILPKPYFNRTIFI